MKPRFRSQTKPLPLDVLQLAVVIDALQPGERGLVETLAMALQAPGYAFALICDGDRASNDAPPLAPLPRQDALGQQAASTARSKGRGQSNAMRWTWPAFAQTKRSDLAPKSGARSARRRGRETAPFLDT